MLHIIMLHYFLENMCSSRADDYLEEHIFSEQKYSTEDQIVFKAC